MLSNFSLVNLLIILGLFVLVTAAIAIAIVATVFGVRGRLARMRRGELP